MEKKTTKKTQEFGSVKRRGEKEEIPTNMKKTRKKK
jgi:hypothetical protein